MIDKANIKNLYRLSPLQGGMLFHALYDEGARSYFEQGVYRIDGTIDVSVFEQAWNAVVERHDALRTAFIVKGVPEPLQVVLKKRPLDFRFEDITDSEAVTQEERIANICAQDKERGFDLTRDPLLRIALFRCAEDRYTMILSFHHIIMDGWCQGILASEFTTIYTSLRHARPVPLPPAPQYREYIRWLERQDKEEGLAYWKNYLKGFAHATNVPQRAEKKEKSVAAEQGAFSFRLTHDETAALNEFAQRNGVTLSTVVQGLWGVLLGELNGTEDSLFLSTVSGRPDDLENAENIVGLFINALPVRVQMKRGERFAQLVIDLRKNAGESQPYQFAPLAEIQAKSALKREIANTLLVFENYPFAPSGDDAPFSIAQQSIDERTNYDVTVQVHPGEELGFGIAFDSERIDPELIARMGEWIAEASRRIAGNPEITVAEFSRDGVGFTQDVAKEEREKLKPLHVAVAGTFTVDPAVPYLMWWLRERGYAPSVEIAPYNQIFQELLDPSSLLSRAEDFGLLAVRFEDWIRDLADESEEEILRHLEHSYTGYCGALDGFSGTGTLIHILLPTDFSPFSSAVAEKLRELGERIVATTADRGNLFLLDARNLHTDYAIGNPFDRVADRAGHVPYTPEMNAAIGTAVARKFLARDQHPFKVIAVDCDNTLWKGVCGEDGATGVRIYGGYRALQQFLIERYEEGFLIALCSKNNENDVWEVFEKNEGMLLKREHVVAHRINWLPKSGNLYVLADELNVGINSFIFIDDSGMECAEVQENASDVLTLRLPEDEEAIDRFTRHIWGLDKWQITDEDRKRSSMYVAEQQRQQGEEQATSLEEFLRGLGLKIVMAPIADHQISRVSQLTQRTNQFNISTIRRDESEIRGLVADDRYYCRIITVEDRFGEYGLVGVIICRKEEEKKTLFVDSLLLSCRVLGRGVEEALLSGIHRFAVANGLTDVEALFIPTKKNAPALNFLQTWPENGEEAENGNITFRRSVHGLPNGIPFGEFEDRTEPIPEEKNDEKPSSITPTASRAEREKEREEAEAAPEEIAAGWTIDVKEIEILFHAAQYLPLAYASGSDLLALPLAAETEGSGRAPYVLPETPDALALVELFGDVLRVDPTNPVGMRDDFFTLGGHSLTAVELLSRIHRQFRTEISLREIFEHPTPERLLERIRAGEALSLPPITSIPQTEFYELSHAQERLWALDDIQSEGTAYVMGGGMLVEGRLDADALESAFCTVLRRHESLRTGIFFVEDRPMMKVFDGVPFSIERIDLSDASLSAEEKEERAKEIAEERSRERFDLSSPPLLRVSLIRLEENRHVLILLLHHIVADGWSYTVLLRELVALYNAYHSAKSEVDPDTLLDPLPIHYKEYAAWQREALMSDRAQNDEAFWLNRLAGPLPVVELPTDRPRPAQPNYAGGTVQVTIGTESAKAAGALCRNEGATLFTFLLASVRTLLWRYAGARETVIGVPVAGRDHPDLADQIGFYVNTLALRGAVDPALSFAQTLRAVREEVLESFAHRSTPFDLIAKKLSGTDRDTSRSPIFDVMVALQNNREFNEEIEGIRFRPFGEEAGAGKFDLVFNFNETAEGIICRLEYRTELFDGETITAIGEELERLIDEAAHRPNNALIDIGVRLDDLLSASRHVVEATVPEGTMIDRFRTVVHRFPEKIAVAQGADQITYRELDERSDHIAAGLVTHGVKKGEIVAVLLERSVDLIAVMLGIMKRGALYLPIDPAYPQGRIQSIVEDSRGVMVVGNEGTEFPHGCARTTIADILGNDAGNVTSEENVSADDPAYVIYTSGSTGRPKGVCVRHGGFMNMIAAQIETFGVTEADTVLQFASPAFDASLSEIFMALLAGASLRIPERKDVEEIESFLHLLEETNVSVATIPPVYLRAIERRPMPTLRVLITAGEEAPRADVLHYAQSMAVFNAYGPTECSVCATIHRVDPQGAEGMYATRIPIGEPISGVGALVADDSLLPLPDGVPGELILYGAGLAEGYVNNSAATDERFVIPSWFGGTRCYRTGDRVRRLRSGAFEFLGRIDNQVKIRGHRVEPEEGRQGLLQIAGVRDAAVLVADDPASGKSLIAFVCGDPSLNAAAVQNEAIRILPSFLLPTRIYVIDTLPMTVNGKVDKKGLEELLAQGDGTEREHRNAESEPQTEIEQVLATVFADVLRLDRVGIHENFFALGGDSMKAIQVRAALGRQGYDLRSRHIFEGGTIAGIAAHVRTIEADQAERKEVEGAIPTTPIQTWMTEQLSVPEWSAFGLPLVADATAPIDAKILKGAVLDVANGHDALRVRGRIEGERLQLEIGPRFGEIDLHEFDLRDAENDVQERRSAIIQSLSSAFTFNGTSALFNAALLRTPEQDVVILALHHAIADALSLDILLEDLNNAYAARQDGKEYLPVHYSASFGTWAQSIEEYAESISDLRREEWKGIAEEVQDAAPVFNAREGSDGSDGTRSFLLAIDPSITREVLAARRRGIEPHHLLLAALRRTVEEITGNPEPAVMIEGHGRGGETSLDITRTVGWFTAVYPILLSAEHASAREEVESIRTKLNAVKGREGEYGALRYSGKDEALRSKLRTAPQISFNYLGEYRVGPVSSTRLFEHTRHDAAGENRSLIDFEMHGILEDGTFKFRCTCGPTVPDSFADQFGARYSAQVEAVAAELNTAEQVQMRLICLPWVGGDTRSFNSLAAALPFSIDILPLELPGHGARLYEEALERVEEILPDLIAQINESLDLPYALFGHSMGGVLAYEAAHALREMGLPEPEMLICAGVAAPREFTKGREGKERADEEMIAAFYSDGTDGVTKEERDRMIAAAQADMRASQNYRYTERKPLAIPIAVLYGTEDDIPTEAMAGWKDETTEETSFYAIAGGHDFPAQNPADTAARIVELCEGMKLEITA